MTPRAAYAAFMLGALVIFVLVRRCFPSPGGLATLPLRERLVILLSAFVGGVLGAKLPFVFVRGADWFGDAWMADGKTVTTGLIGAYVAVEISKWIIGLKVKTGDAFALPLALALAVGRWGCFFNGCCHGAPTDLPWAVDFGDGTLRHPTQIYESIFHFTMAVALIVIIRRGWLKNQRLKFYLIGYGIYRFLTEFIRPEPVYALGLTYFQWVCLLMVLALSAHWWYDARQMTADGSTRLLEEPL